MAQPYTTQWHTAKMKNEALQSELEAEVQAGTITRDSNGRGGHGRFAPGCQAGPGRPKRLDYRGLCEFIRERVTERDMEEIIQVALEQAKDGDRYAREFVLKIKRDAVKGCERFDSYREAGFEIGRASCRERV